MKLKIFFGILIALIALLVACQSGQTAPPGSQNPCGPTGNNPLIPGVPCPSPSPTVTPTPTPTPSPSPSPSLPPNNTPCNSSQNSDWVPYSTITGQGNFAAIPGQWWNGYCVPFHVTNHAEWGKYGSQDISDVTMNAFFSYAQDNTAFKPENAYYGCHGEQVGYGCYSMTYTNPHVIVEDVQAGCTSKSLPDAYEEEVANALEPSGTVTYGEDPTQSFDLHAATPPPPSPIPAYATTNRLEKINQATCSSPLGTVNVNKQLGNVESSWSQLLWFAYLHGTLSNTTFPSGVITSTVTWSFPSPGATATPYGATYPNLGGYNLVEYDLSNETYGRANGYDPHGSFELDPTGSTGQNTAILQATNTFPGLIAADYSFDNAMQILTVKNGLGISLGDTDDAQTCNPDQLKSVYVLGGIIENPYIGFAAGITQGNPTADNINTQSIASFINCMTLLSSRGKMAAVDNYNVTWGSQGIAPTPTPIPSGATPGPSPTPWPLGDDMYDWREGYLAMQMLGWYGYNTAFMEKWSKTGTTDPTDTIAFYPEYLFWFRNPVVTATTFVPGSYVGPKSATNNGTGCGHDNSSGGAHAYLLLCGRDQGGNPAGVYAREFQNCYFNHSPPGVADPNISIGQCAAIINETATTFTMSTFYPAKFRFTYGHYLGAKWPTVYKSGDLAGQSIGNSWSGEDIAFIDQGTLGGNSGAICGPSTANFGTGTLGSLPYGNPPSNCPVFSGAVTLYANGGAVIMLQ